MKSMSKGKKVLFILLAVIVVLIGVSVITDTPPFVVIKGKVYPIFTKTLHLDGEFSNKDVKALSHLRWVKNLSMECTLITDLSFLRKMNSLKIMSYNGHNIENKTCNNIDDWYPLSNCKELERFVGINLDISDLSAFNGTENLKVLYIERHPSGLGSTNPEYSLTNISDVKLLVNLEIFEIFGNDIDDISSLRYCTKLREITLYGITATDGSALLELPELERLEIDKGVLTEKQVNMLREKGVDVHEREISE